MKVNFNAIVLLSVIMCMSSVVLAEDAMNLSESDKKEISSFNVPYGAEVRLLELQKRIAKNTLEGAKIVEILNRTYPSRNLTKLEAILDEMTYLLDEAKLAADLGNKTQMVGEFVAIKKDAIELSWRFREESEPLLNKSIRRDIRHEIANTTFTPINKTEAELKKLRNLYNQKIMEAILNESGITDDTLLQKIGNGDYTTLQIRERLQKDLDKLEAKDLDTTAYTISELKHAMNDSLEALITDSEGYYQEKIKERKIVKQRLKERENGSESESYTDRLVSIRTKLETKESKSAGNGSGEGK